MTLGDLQNADSWYVNEYRGGKNNGGGVVDWSTVYMSTLDFRGNWENQNEGCTLQVLEEDEPANLNAFESFVFGKKAISEENNILTLYIRTHDASEDAPAYYGVQVIDLEAAEPTIEYVGDKQNTYASSDYSDVTFDLSKYNGKEIHLAIRLVTADGYFLTIDNVGFYGNVEHAQGGISNIKDNGWKVAVDGEELTCTAENVNNITIYDISGRFAASSNSQTVNISGLQKGIYIAVITADGQTLQYKFAK